MGFKKQLQVLLVGFSFAALSLAAGTSFKAALGENSWDRIGISGLCILVFGLATVICVDIWRLQPADSHTLRTLYSQYKEQTIQRLKRPYHMWLLRSFTKDPKKLSERSLMRILKLTQSSEYSRKHKFEQIRSREDFVSMHPITDYEHFRGYINRVIKGEKDVLFPGKPFYLGKTSGTTGNPKFVPYNTSAVQPIRLMFSQMHESSFVHLRNLKRNMRFYLYSPIEMINNLPCGVVGMALATSTPHNLIPSLYSKLHQEEAAYYAMALFSLAERELQYIYGFSSDLMYSYMKFMMQHRESLCNDIARGEISTVVEMPNKIREGLSKDLKADPSRAADIMVQLKKGGIGLVKRLWPDLDFIIMSQSGSFRMSANLLAESFMKGVKTMPYGHGSSEALYGHNINSLPGTGDHMTLACYPNFLELIPVADVDVEQPKTIFPEKAKVGGEYEIVVTTEYGLFRYRTGDVIKVVGFTNNTPKYEIMYRLGCRLAISWEQTPENLICEVMKQTKKVLPPGVELVNFVTTESMALDQISERPTEQDYKAFYAVFIELNTEQAVDVTKIAKEFDSRLKKEYLLYNQYRENGTIGQPKMFQTRPDTFLNVKQLLLRGKTNSQFKFPHVLRNPECLKALYKDLLYGDCGEFRF